MILFLFILNKMPETQRDIAARCETQGHTTGGQLTHAYLFVLCYWNSFGS